MEPPQITDSEIDLKKQCSDWADLVLKLNMILDSLIDSMM